MNFRKVNNITGWAVFFIAFLTYFFTREARGSLWDCGEFVSSAYKVQLPHPPGAPLFVLLGRFFIILFGDNGNTAANAVNTMSALASGATILFLFWTITHFARKMFVNVGEELTAHQAFTVMAAGAVGALAYTFSDSFWFSAGEGEVYALSSFFTALVFWLMLKWEHADEHAGIDPQARARSDRWIVVLFFMMGLSIGVHILNLLTIPAIVMIYYYRRYQATNKGAIVAFIVGLVITGIVQLGVIQYSMKAAGQFDVFFKNTMGLPFFTGFTIYFLAIAALIAWALRFNEKNISKPKLILFFTLFLGLSMLPFIISLGSGGLKILKFLLIGGAGLLAGYFLKPGALKMLKLSLWCYAFMMLGYFMYFTALIRSNANPAIDMNNVDNPINLVYYLSREQYGEAPLVYGTHFAARVPEDIDQEDPYVEGEMRYVKGKTKYVPIGRKTEYRYNSDVKQIFPRVWDPSNDQGHADFYAEWLNLGQYQDPQTGKVSYEAPTYADNFNWFFTYQMGLMYWRYFMWNFSGKQNDVQGLGNKRDGNWISGISFIDNKRLGNQSELPDSLKNNKAHNTLYMLPFILGMIGCVYQFLRNKKDWIVTFLLFFMTGIAVVFYLNQPGNQPRERDYAYVGSFYAFAIWIGLAVVAFVRLAREKADKLAFQNTLIYGSVLTFFITLMSSFPGSGGDILMTSIYATVLYAAITAAITYLVRAVSSGGENSRLLNISTTVVCLLVPLLMAQQEWDDHDRSGKTTAPDMAKDYLESCAPNAVIFTFGDNDTYPLWYAQEVEGVRPDIRIINNSLLGIDWYINQLRYKVNNSDSLDVIWSEEQIEGHNREYLRYREQGDKSTFYNLYNIMKNEIGKKYEDPDTKRDVGSGYFPVANFYVPVDSALARKNGTVNATDVILPELRFQLPENRLQSGNGLLRSDLIILNIIATNAANGWSRPIYFTSPFGELGFGQYLRKEGLAYRLVPAKPRDQASNWMIRIFQKDNNTDDQYQKMMNKFVFDSKKGVYFDEENRRHVLSLRNAYAEAAGDMADEGKKQEALKLLEKSETLISAGKLPYAMTSRGNSHNINGLAYLEACYKAGNMQLAQTVKGALKKDFEQQKKYYDYIRAERPDLFIGFDGRDGEAARNEYFLQLFGDLVKHYEPETIKPTTEGPVNIIKPSGPDSINKKDSNKPK
ncbi:MAG TPA: DUF2723 domain-containing protein [Chitinophagaceae bacterium]|nr:DUF2723 domain-containing protein [Chitinophagaceae bacterium]